MEYPEHHRKLLKEAASQLSERSQLLCDTELDGDVIMTELLAGTGLGLEDLEAVFEPRIAAQLDQAATQMQATNMLDLVTLVRQAWLDGAITLAQYFVRKDQPTDPRDSA